MAYENERQTSQQTNGNPQSGASGEGEYDPQNALDQQYGHAEEQHDLNRSPASYDQEAQHVAGHVLDTLESEARERTKDTGGMVGGLPGTVATAGNEANEDQLGRDAGG